ncbi:MAG: hypothetical protein EOO97_00070 [Pedobacter sp.]|nr:MAG: hypothetical protein EOO97_00070 [Pedobacter sp.]
MAKNSIPTGDNFTQVSVKLRRSTLLDGNDKLLISYILGWQKVGRPCTASNPTLAFELGVSQSTLKRMINKLNKLPFFNSEKKTTLTERGGHLNSKEMNVDLEALDVFLNQHAQAKPSMKKVVPKVEAVVETDDDFFNVDFQTVYGEEGFRKLKPIGLPAQPLEPLVEEILVEVEELPDPQLIFQDLLERKSKVYKNTKTLKQMMMVGIDPDLPEPTKAAVRKLIEAMAA